MLACVLLLPSARLQRAVWLGTIILHVLVADRYHMISFPLTMTSNSIGLWVSACCNITVTSDFMLTSSCFTCVCFHVGKWADFNLTLHFKAAGQKATNPASQQVSWQRRCGENHHINNVTKRRPPLLQGIDSSLPSLVVPVMEHWLCVLGLSLHNQCVLQRVIRRNYQNVHIQKIMAKPEHRHSCRVWSEVLYSGSFFNLCRWLSEKLLVVSKVVKPSSG